jgi:predicted nucleic acid-binding protein
VLLPDVNVLVAGFRADHDHHTIARHFLEEGAELITFDRGFRRYPRLRSRCLLDA